MDILIFMVSALFILLAGVSVDFPGHPLWDWWATTLAQTIMAYLLYTGLRQVYDFIAKILRGGD